MADGVAISLDQAVGWTPTIVRFSMGGENYTVRNATKVVKNVNPANNEGTEVGEFNGSSLILLDTWVAGTSPLITNSNGVTSSPVSGEGSVANTDGVTFRTASAPLVPGAFSVLGSFTDGTTFNVTADTDTGEINDDGVVGRVDYQTGVVELRFGTPTVSTGTGTVDVSYLGVTGVTRLELAQVGADTLRYNAVAYSYIPLDAEILGLDPVRLPADGRVPIFRAGTVAVVHHTAVSAPMSVTNGQTVSLGRTRVSRVRVFGDDGVAINTGFTVNRVAGTVTFTSVAGYDQPITIENRIEDAALVSDAQISGLIRFTRPMTHDYPDGSMVSSALLLGDMFARVSAIYDQGTWTNVWSNDLIGSAASATYDSINHPPTVLNEDAVTERWAIVFTGTTNFNIIGEHLGQVGSSNTTLGAAPLNPATGNPYFELSSVGFGGGWAAGNVIRINTVGALRPVWVSRVVQQGEPTETSDSFTLLVRGDVDTP